MHASGMPQTRDVLAGGVKGFGDKVYHPVMSRTVRFPDATVAGEPITRFDPTSNGAHAYRELAKEVLDRWHQADLAVPAHGGANPPGRPRVPPPRAPAPRCAGPARPPPPGRAPPRSPHLRT